MSVVGRLDRFQRRHKAMGFPLAVVYKFADDQGNFLAALITYYAFLSVFPLLLLGTSILGFLLQGNTSLRQEILDSALSQFPGIGDQLGQPDGLRGSGIAVAVGAVGALYGAMGVAQATQNAMNTAWAVPRNRRPNPLMTRVRSLTLLATAGVAVLGTTILSVVGNNIDLFVASRLGAGYHVVVSVVSVLVNCGVFVLLFRLSTTHRHSMRAAVPGALVTALVWQLLQIVGSLYVGSVMGQASVTNGVFAIVLGMIAWLYLGAMTVVLGAEINVVRENHLYPRALLTPFTDNVDLTSADQRAYSDYAAAQRTKDFETVDVSFDHDGQNATARSLDGRQ